MHKIGVTLTVLFAIAGFWDYKAFYESDVFEMLGPLTGLIVFCGGMKFILDRPTDCR